MHQLASLRAAFRRYATGASRSRLDGTLSLEHFLQRSRVLALYRRIVRGTHHIGDPTLRAETHRYARGEFERNRDVTDLAHIRYLVSTGKTEWEAMERYIGRP
ncbi:complex 1 lyr protein [Grosmannia clavigera kw1407]|uniref:LYR motif-containing protein 2 n=1 Tax=Grosmannia clavigera (strain kw1407 / UAMH 11150) TaxID=655863 RepID=F0XAB2_GROCL|nr:complex 1 lyr protein [Grosmannia clavigera kw1407]EFX05217.1 complex 1 lyr protein [Grosmannia clavigera kw1407]